MAKKPTINKEVAALVDARDVIKAVQLQMKVAHQGLKEAKDTVDAYRRGEYVVEGTNQGPSVSELCNKIADLLNEETHDSILEAANVAEDLYDILLDSDLDDDEMVEMVDVVTVTLNVAILISVPEKYDVAVKKLQKFLDEKAEGNLTAYCHYGLYVAYSAGRGVEVDEMKAYDHASAATMEADEGDNIELDINVAIATCYFNGWGVDSDIESARMYYEMARDWKSNDPEDEDNPVENIMTKYSLENYNIMKEMLEPQTVTACTVKLMDIGSDKRAMRNFLVKECDKSVDEAVKLMIKIKGGEAFMVAEGIGKSEADKLVAKIDAAGGTAEVDEETQEMEREQDSCGDSTEACHDDGEKKMKTLKVTISSHNAYDINFAGFFKSSDAEKLKTWTREELYENGGNTSGSGSFIFIDDCGSGASIVVEDEDGNTVFENADFSLYNYEYLKKQETIAEDYLDDDGNVDEEDEDYQNDMKVLNSEVTFFGFVLPDIFEALRNNEMEPCDFMKRYILNSLGSVEDNPDYVGLVSNFNATDCWSEFVYEIQIPEDEDFDIDKLFFVSSDTEGELECSDIISELLNTEDLICMDFIGYDRKYYSLEDSTFNTDGDHDYDSDQNDFVDCELQHVDI